MGYRRPAICFDTICPRHSRLHHLPTLCLVLTFIVRTGNRCLEPVPPQVPVPLLHGAFSCCMMLNIFFVGNGLDTCSLMVASDSIVIGFLIIPFNLAQFLFLFRRLHVVFLASFIFSAVFGIVTMSAMLAPRMFHRSMFYAPTTKLPDAQLRKYKVIFKLNVDRTTKRMFRKPYPLFHIYRAKLLLGVNQIDAIAGRYHI